MAASTLLRGFTLFADCLRRAGFCGATPNAPASQAASKVFECAWTCDAQSTEACNSLARHLRRWPKSTSSSAVAEPARPLLRRCAQASNRPIVWTSRSSSKVSRRAELSVTRSSEGCRARSTNGSFPNKTGCKNATDTACIRRCTVTIRSASELDCRTSSPADNVVRGWLSARGEKRKESALGRAQTRASASALEARQQGFVGNVGKRREDMRMHIRLPADGDRVAEHLGDVAQELLQGRPARVAPAPLQPQRERLRRPVPRAEVLGGEVLAGDHADVVVDVGRSDGMGDAIVVDVLEELLAGHRLAAANDARHPRIVERHLVLLAALAAKAQPQSAARDGGVAVAQRRQAE